MLLFVVKSFCQDHLVSLAQFHMRIAHGSAKDATCMQRRQIFVILSITITLVHLIGPKLRVKGFIGFVGLIYWNSIPLPKLSLGIPGSQFENHSIVIVKWPAALPVWGFGIPTPEKIPEGTGRWDLCISRVKDHADVFGDNSGLDAMVELRRGYTRHI